MNASVFIELKNECSAVYRVEKMNAPVYIELKNELLGVYRVVAIKGVKI